VPAVWGSKSAPRPSGCHGSSGGILVYSVCTLTRAETVDVDEWAVEHLNEFVAVTPPDEPWQPLGRGALLLPQTAGTDGMFVVALQRRA